MKDEESLFKHIAHVVESQSDKAKRGTERSQRGDDTAIRVRSFEVWDRLHHHKG